MDLRCLNEIDPANSCYMTFRVAVGKGWACGKGMPCMKERSQLKRSFDDEERSENSLSSCSATNGCRS